MKIASYEDYQFYFLAQDIKLFLRKENFFYLNFLISFDIVNALKIFNVFFLQFFDEIKSVIHSDTRKPQLIKTSRGKKSLLFINYVQLAKILFSFAK
ncbi:hypothetical protein RFI_32668 [Reticulomyxa filosa]|uniref:Uncharacterized protein n=1 Tax=Reticulomyxa filosa TaxID=46433 RepID=X6LS55_RETFI|nr:hypothetical protein RFI_32668 [Reticulomyxa filosa]|eukprot:ETO04728.1 hypothetical protein RFI_32668 [Reticulomyxa filosa]